VETSEFLITEEDPRLEKQITDAIFDSVPGLLYLYDDQGKIVRWNKKHEEMTGYSSEEMAQMHLFDWYRGDDATIAHIAREVENAARNGFACAEANLQKKDGTTIPMYFTAVPLIINDKTYFAGIGIDITERKLAESALQELKEQLEKLVEQRTQELLAANQELTAMNEEMNAINQTLEVTNQQLEEEIAIRQQKEEDLSVRERQYHAITSLLAQPVYNAETLMQTILRDALNLVKAPEGYIGLFDEKKKTFVIHYAVGSTEVHIGEVQPCDGGLRGKVFQTGKTMWVEDYRTYPDRLPYPSLERTTTLVTVPLTQAELVTGVFSVNWIDSPHNPTQEEIDIVRQYGVLASVALERTGILAKISRQNQLLQALAHTTNAVIEHLDLETILQEILERASELVGLSSGFILLLQPDGESLKFTNVKGKHQEKSGATISLSSMAGHVLKTGKLLYLEDYHNWPERIAAPFFDEITTALQAPLNVDGKTIGVIGFASFGEVAAIDEERLTLLDQFARVASIALKNALLHQDTVSLAFHDTLTGLPNRTSLAARLESEMEKARLDNGAGALMFIDLDDLKVVNDNYGHSFGDAVIITAGRHILEAVMITASPKECP